MPCIIGAIVEQLATMRMRKKADLPTKVCVTCGRPYTWRKKWAQVWDAVLYCSEKCRRTPRNRPGNP